jgi:hypothetical protein
MRWRQLLAAFFFFSAYGAQNNSKTDSINQSLREIGTVLDSISSTCIDKTTAAQALRLLQSNLKANGSDAPEGYAQAINTMRDAWRAAAQRNKTKSCDFGLLIKDLDYKAQDSKHFGPRLVPVKISPLKSGRVVPNWQVVAQSTAGPGAQLGPEIPLRKISRENIPAVGELAPGTYVIQARMGYQVSHTQYAFVGWLSEGDNTGYDCDLPLP